jgi:hypothetical protein
MLVEQPLNLVKKDRKRKLSSLDGKADAVLCKLCNVYVATSLLESHVRYVVLRAADSAHGAGNFIRLLRKFD